MDASHSNEKSTVKYALHLFFRGLSFRGKTRALNIFSGKRSHAMVRNWIQPFSNSFRNSYTQ